MCEETNIPYRSGEAGAPKRLKIDKLLKKGLTDRQIANRQAFGFSRLLGEEAGAVSDIGQPEQGAEQQEILMKRILSNTLDFM